MMHLNDCAHHDGKPCTCGEDPPKSKGGRPSGYTPELAAEICSRMSGGESIRSICAEEGMPDKAQIFRWLAMSPAFRDQYAIACEARMSAMAEEILEIADDSSGDVSTDEEGNVRQNSEFAARSRLRVDTRKWLMARMAPKKYGDKVVQEIQGAGGGPVQIQRIERVIIPALPAPKREDETE